MKRSSSKRSPLSDGPDLRCHAAACRLEKNVASWISLSALSRPHPSPLFFFYQQQWVHFTPRKMIKAMQIGLKLCRRWRAERDRSLLPLELKDLILNLYVPPEAWESSHPSFVGWRELMIARGPRAVRLVNFMTAMSPSFCLGKLLDWIPPKCLQLWKTRNSNQDRSQKKPVLHRDSF